ncbi:unnamed protein product [Ectocarpus sp. CCAP 1310/34]|nr:unnamed protein product [Ectocarpus sp. CCAP 1310/34]
MGENGASMLAAIVFNIVVYVRIFSVVRRFSTEISGGASAVGPSAEQQMRMTKFSKRLVWYPAVLIASWTFATINRIQNAIDPDHPISGLFLLHTSLVAFQGFFNALVYGSTDAVKASVVQELLVERCLKASGACRGGRGESGQRDNNGLDPEDAEDSSMGMGTTGNGRYNDESLGGFGDVEMDATGDHRGSASGARVSGVDVTGISNDLKPNDDESVEVYSSTSKQGWSAGER